jgi:hypothetical protein
VTWAPHGDVEALVNLIREQPVPAADLHRHLGWGALRASRALHLAQQAGLVALDPTGVGVPRGTALVRPNSSYPGS